MPFKNLQPRIYDKFLNDIEWPCQYTGQKKHKRTLFDHINTDFVNYSMHIESFPCAKKKLCCSYTAIDIFPDVNVFLSEFFTNFSELLYKFWPFIISFFYNSLYTYPVNKLLANCRQIGIKLAQRLMTNPVPSVSAISLCFAS